MKIIECEFYDGKLALVNISNICYCYLITKDGYGDEVDEIKICFNDGSTLIFKKGRKTYKLIKEIENE